MKFKEYLNRCENTWPSTPLIMYEALYEAFKYKNIKGVQGSDRYYYINKIFNYKNEDYEYQFTFMLNNDDFYENKFVLLKKGEPTTKLQNKFSGIFVKNVLAFNLSFVDYCLDIIKPDKWVFYGGQQHSLFYQHLFKNFKKLIPSNEFKKIGKYYPYEMKNVKRNNEQNAMVFYCKKV